MNHFMRTLTMRKIMKDNKTMIVNPLVPAKMVDDSLPSAWSEFNSKYKL